MSFKNASKYCITVGLLLAFVFNGLAMPSAVAQVETILPPAGFMVALSPAGHPPILKGIKVLAQNPLSLDFILDQGDSVIARGSSKEEVMRLITYFLAGLTIPEGDLWVNRENSSGLAPG